MESKKLFKIKGSTEIRNGDKELRQKEKCIPSESEVRWTGEIYHSREKIHLAKAQFEQKLDRTVGGKKNFRYILAEVSGEITSACYRMKMVTSQTREKEEVLNAFCASFLNIDDGWRISIALSWRNMAVRMTSSQLTMKQSGISCSRWTLVNLWGLMEFT